MVLRQVSRQISFPSNNPVKPPSEKGDNKEIKKDRFAKHFLENIKLFFEEAKQGSVDFLSDFTIKSGIDGIEHKSHKIILASQSKYFRGFFRNNPTESSVSLDFENSIIEACLEGIYTGTTPLTFDNVQDILIASDYLGIEDLVKQAEKFIIFNMDDSNCYDILVFGCDQGHDELAASAASYISSGIFDEPGLNNEELFALPSKMFAKVLASDGLIIKERQSGLILTGLIRELKILPIIEKHLSVHPETKLEDLIPCCRLDGFDFRGVGKYHLVKQTLLIILDTNLDREEKVSGVNRAVQMSHEMDDSPINDEVLEQLGSEVVVICEEMSEELKERLIDYAKADHENNRFSVSLGQRRFNKRVSRFGRPYARAPNHSFERDTLSDHGKHFGIVKKIKIHTRLWDDRNIIKGLEVHFSGKDKSIKFGLEDGPGGTVHEYELDEGEHVSYVEGRSGWFLDQITFVTNKNRKLGPIGGDGGDKFSTFRKFEENPSKKSFWYLGGIEAWQVRTGESYAIARIRFLMCMIYDKELSDDQESPDMLAFLGPDPQYDYIDMHHVINGHEFSDDQTDSGEELDTEDEDYIEIVGDNPWQ